MICPCKDCVNKGCGIYHSKCKPYLDYVEWKKQVNENERKAKQFSYNIKNKRRNKWKIKN